MPSAVTIFSLHLYCFNLHKAAPTTIATSTIAPLLQHADRHSRRITALLVSIYLPSTDTAQPVSHSRRQGENTAFWIVYRLPLPTLLSSLPSQYDDRPLDI